MLNLTALFWLTILLFVLLFVTVVGMSALTDKKEADEAHHPITVYGQIIYLIICGIILTLNAYYVIIDPEIYLTKPGIYGIQNSYLGFGQITLFFHIIHFMIAFVFSLKILGIERKRAAQLVIIAFATAISIFLYFKTWNKLIFSYYLLGISVVIWLLFKSIDSIISETKN